MRVVFVHGACVRDGSWWWHRTAGLLLERACKVPRDEDEERQPRLDPER